ncbi:MAG TPA: autotransporter outer membrane beta-barrel domain-containing protein [Pararobbsia sp.]|nr:autotransporter outer membrane beta-barrel domain-containing protein [Pararobbsia sp.]
MSTAIAAIFTTAGVRPASAQSVTGTGDLDPSPATSPNWVVNSDLNVGATGTGSLDIEAGGTVNNTGVGFIGNGVGSQGTVTVSGHDTSGNASSWTTGSDLVVGQDGTGQLSISDGAKVTTSGTGYIAGSADGSGTVTVTGRDTNGNASTWTMTGDLWVGQTGNGTLSIEDGAVVSNGNGVIGGGAAGTQGSVIVTGTGSTWTNAAQNTLNIGFSTSGSLLVEDGGLVNSGEAVIGTDLGGTGLATVTGSGSTWNANNIYLGGEFGQATGTLLIEDGGTVNVSAPNPGGPPAAATVYIGYVAGGQGTVTVSSTNGSVSTLSVTDAVDVGEAGTGTLNIESGGLVSVGSDTRIAVDSGSSGTLNLEGDASGRGVLATGSVIKGAGATAILNLDGGVLRATRDEPDYLNGFTALTVNTGGAWFDTDSFDIGIATDFSGSSSLNKQGLGTLTLNGDSSAFTGTTNVTAGTLAVGDATHANAILGTSAMTVAAGATLGGYGTVSGPVTNAGTVAVANALADFSTEANGTFTIAGDLTNQGVANLAASSGQIGNVLKVNGNYTGSNGQLVLNTLLNEGGAATKTDQLLITGNANGSTSLVVHGTGAGAQTIGDGIQVVGVTGNSAANSFRLANVVQGGAYQYFLYQGGATTANSNWYLRSTFEASSTGTAPPASDPPTGAANSTLSFRPATVAYSMTPSLNSDYGFATLGRLHERVGDVASVEANPQNANGAVNKDGFWGRISGEDFDANASNRFSTQQNTFLAQLGKDWTLARTPDGGSTHAGATVSIGSASATFDDSMRSLAQLSTQTGSLETQAQSIGGYWTRYFADGTYFDGVGQLTHYQNKYGDVLGDNASQNGFGVGASAEVGKPFVFGSSRVAIEPQVQLLYQYLHLNAFNDGVSPVSGTSQNALRGRAGFRLFRANLSNDSGTGAATPYLTADVLHDFLSPSQTTVGGTAFQSNLSKTWYEVGAGVTASAGKSSELYVNVKYARNIGGEYQRSVYGQAGYRYSW